MIILIIAKQNKKTSCEIYPKLTRKAPDQIRENKCYK